MARSKQQTVPVPKKLDDLVEFCETHDMGDYLEQMPEAEFEIEIIEIIEVSADRPPLVSNGPSANKPRYS